MANMRSFAAAMIGGVVGAVFASMAAVAWTGPSQAPPNGNVAAPIHVGATDQVKNAGLSVNALAVFGNGIISGTSRYLNWGTSAGSSGYGLRDNAGTMEVKDANGSWNRFATTTSMGAFNQVRFSDGTVQTTASGAGAGLRTSPQLAVTMSSVVSWAHGLGIAPVVFGAYLVNVTADQGFVPGERIQINTTRPTGGMGGTTYADSSVVKFRTGYAGYYVSNPSGNSGELNLANWRVVFFVLDK